MSVVLGDNVREGNCPEECYGEFRQKYPGNTSGGMFGCHAGLQVSTFSGYDLCHPVNTDAERERALTGYTISSAN